MSHITIDDIITLYELQKHPEGGYFKESYRDERTIAKVALPKSFSGDRNFSTAIYFLLPEGEKSHLHKIKSDEVWHFYLGGPLTLIQILKNGDIQKFILGQDVKSGQKLQHVVPAGSWFGAYPNKGSCYSFVGCTVAPGFDFSDFEMGDRLKLIEQFPNAEDVIKELSL